MGEAISHGDLPMTYEEQEQHYQSMFERFEAFIQIMNDDLYGIHSPRLQREVMTDHLRPMKSKRLRIALTGIFSMAAVAVPYFL